MKQVLLIALGGAFGSVSRYGIAKFVNNITGGSFPWGTMAVNFLGLFIIGFLYELFEKTVIPPEIRAFCTIGFLGGLTTFSTYGMETVNLFKNNQYISGLFNIIASNACGLVMVIAGIALARIIFRVA